MIGAETDHVIISGITIGRETGRVTNLYFQFLKEWGVSAKCPVVDCPVTAGHQVLCETVHNVLFRPNVRMCNVHAIPCICTVTIAILSTSCPSVKLSQCLCNVPGCGKITLIMNS